MTEPIFSSDPAHDAGASPAAAAAKGEGGLPTSAAGWERATLEKLAMATLIEQRQARRWRNGIRMAWALRCAGSRRSSDAR